MNKIKFAKAQQAKGTTATKTKRKSPMIPTQIFGLTRKIAKSDYELHAWLFVRLSLCMSIGMELASH